MSYIIIQSRRTRQPQGAVRVTAEWLSRGLVASFTPSAGFVDLARNNNASGIVGNITNAVGSQGRAWAGAYQGSNNYVLIPRTNDLAYTSGVTFEALITVNAFQTNVFPYISGVISQAHETSGVYYGPVLRFNSTASVGNAAQPVFFVSQSGVEKQATGALQSTNVPIHLIGLYNGANSVLWVNGVKTVGAAVTGSIDNNVNNFITLLSDFVGTADVHKRCLNGNLYFANIYNRGLTDAEALDRYLFRWGHLRPDPSRIYFGASGGAGETTGAASITQSPQTLTGAGAVAVAGSATVTPAAQTVTTAATVAVAATATISPAAQTATTVATVAVAGTAGITPAAQTVSATGTVVSGVVGTASITPAAQTATASGTVPVAATASITPAAQTLSGSVTVSGGAVTGTANVYASAQTLVAAANIIVVGTVNITPAAQTLLAYEAGTLPAEVPGSSRTLAAQAARLGASPVAADPRRLGATPVRKAPPRLG